MFKTKYVRKTARWTICTCQGRLVCTQYTYSVCGKLFIGSNEDFKTFFPVLTLSKTEIWLVIFFNTKGSFFQNVQNSFGVPIFCELWKFSTKEHDARRKSGKEKWFHLPHQKNKTDNGLQRYKSVTFIFYTWTYKYCMFGVFIGREELWDGFPWRHHGVHLITCSVFVHNRL